MEPGGRFENRVNAVRRDACVARGAYSYSRGNTSYCSSLILGQRRFGHHTFISEFQNDATSRGVVVGHDE